MTEGWQPAHLEARLASTRPARITGEQHLTRFTRGALEGMADQIREDFVPITVEHLGYLPPIGRWFDGKVVEAEDGEWELYLQGRELPLFVPDGADPQPLELIDGLPEAVVDNLEVTLKLERRNYPANDWDRLTEESPFPVKIEHRWAGLPPIIYVIALPVIWGAIRFAGAFFEQLGNNSADALAAWLKRAKGRALDPARAALVEFNFELPDGATIMAFLPIDESAEVQIDLTAALNSVGQVASFAGLQSVSEVLPGMRRAAYIYDDGEWQLAWWTDGEAVFTTHWFRRNAPEASKFLGRPLIDTPEQPNDDAE